MTARLLVSLALLSACLDESDVETELAERDQLIADLQAQLDALQARVDVLDPQEASTRLLAAEAQIQRIEERVAGVEAEGTETRTTLANHDIRMGRLESDLGPLVSEVSSQGADVVAQGERLTQVEQWRTLEVEPSFSAIGARVGDLETWRADAEPALADLKTTVTALGVDVAGNAISISSVAARTSKVEGDLTKLGGDFTRLDGVSGRHTSDITALETDLLALTGRVGTCELDVSVLEGRVDAHDADIDTLDRVNGVLTREIASLWAEAVDLRGGVSDLGADIFTLSADVKELEAIEVARWIEKDTVWKVGPKGDFATIEKAWEAALCVRIIPAATLTLQLEGGTHVLKGAWDVSHPDGMSIEIVGDEADPSLVVVEAAAGKDGIVIGAGQALRGVRGLTIDGTFGGSGILAREASYVGLDALVISGFSDGACVDALDGSTVVIADAGIDASTCRVGLRAAWTSLIRAPGATVADTVNQGAFAQYGSVVDVTAGEFDRTGSSAAAASVSSAIAADNANIDTTGDAGLQASYASVVTGSDSVVTRAKQFSYEMGFNSVGVLLGSNSSSPGSNHYYAGYGASFRAERVKGGTGVFFGSSFYTF